MKVTTETAKDLLTRDRKMSREYDLKTRLKDYMTRKGINMSAMSRELGIESRQSFISWYKNDKENLTLDISEKFEEIEAFDIED